MSVIKVIEVLSQSSVSWEDAAKQAVAKAAGSLHNVKSIYIKDHSAKVENGKITSYRITAKVSFVLD
ncbi:MAG: dodecin family protein [Cyclobacteriaceae bacterium]|jgi:flavin-binding protein dodecin|nr:dodecin family protein [Cyclobacteriaceae bacterium]MDH4297697.1 dodecin family protein [Cyclobacteriaceae bacterium]MDH5250377.1 dodecin family protein [Cyclobacteriaceae bacterium]